MALTQHARIKSLKLVPQHDRNMHLYCETTFHISAVKTSQFSVNNSLVCLFNSIVAIKSFLYQRYRWRSILTNEFFAICYLALSYNKIEVALLNYLDWLIFSPFSALFGFVGSHWQQITEHAQSATFEDVCFVGLYVGRSSLPNHCTEHFQLS